MMLKHLFREFLLRTAKSMTPQGQRNSAESSLFDAYPEKRGKHILLPSNKQEGFAKTDLWFLGASRHQRLRDLFSAISKDIGTRSASYELVPNLKKTTVWYYKEQDKYVTLKPVSGIKFLVEQLEAYIHKVYTDKEKKQFSALIKNKLIGKTRKGWTLIEMKD